MSRSVDDGDVVFVGLKLPERDIDGNAPLPLSLELVQNPGILEGSLAHLKQQHTADQLSFVLCYSSILCPKEEGRFHNFP